MSDFFQAAHNTHASGHFTSIGHNQYNNINIIYSSEQESVLATLKPVDRSGYYVPPCTPGTQQWVIEQILHWLEDQHAANILWLSGSPGAGKSTIASTLVSILAEIGRLGSEFFFKRGDAALNDPATIWRTIAFDLAQRDAVIANRVIENLQAGRVNPARADIELHFKYLIEDPLMEFWKKHMEEQAQSAGLKVTAENLATSLPVVVLDALDECGSDSSQSIQRRIFINTIIKWSRLHPSFKLIITSRDQGITPAFRAVSYHIALETGDLVTVEGSLDIQSFFEQRFADIASSCPSLPSTWPGESVIKQLTDRAAGLFIWAETVIRFLEQGFPKGQLDLILRGTFREEGDVIDELYRQILRLSFSNSGGDLLDTFKRVVGAIVLAKTALYRNDLIYFLGRQEDESAIDFVLSKLSSVISTRNTDGRIHISHLSFAEFICDPKRCHDTFVIDCSVHSRIMALACFRVMNANLRFNICEIETSYMRNDDLNLLPRITKAIPRHLSYSCLFGADHLHEVLFDIVIFQEVKDFMYIRLLYWLEVLGLIKEIKTALRALLLIGEWSQVSGLVT